MTRFAVTRVASSVLTTRVIRLFIPIWEIAPFFAFSKKRVILAYRVHVACGEKRNKMRRSLLLTTGFWLAAMLAFALNSYAATHKLTWTLPNITVYDDPDEGTTLTSPADVEENKLIELSVDDTPQAGTELYVILTGTNGEKIEVKHKKQSPTSASFNMPAYDVTLTIEWRSNQKTLSWEDATDFSSVKVEGTEAQLSSGASVAAGAKIEVKATEVHKKPGTVAKLRVNGKSAKKDESDPLFFTFKMPDANATMVLVWEKNTKALKWDASKNEFETVTKHETETGEGTSVNPNDEIEIGHTVKVKIKAPATGTHTDEVPWLKLSDRTDLVKRSSDYESSGTDFVFTIEDIADEAIDMSLEWKPRPPKLIWTKDEISRITIDDITSVDPDELAQPELIIEKGASVEVIVNTDGQEEGTEPWLKIGDTESAPVDGTEATFKFVMPDSDTQLKRIWKDVTQAYKLTFADGTFKDGAEDIAFQFAKVETKDGVVTSGGNVRKGLTVKMRINVPNELYEVEAVGSKEEKDSEGVVTSKFGEKVSAKSFTDSEGSGWQFFMPKEDIELDVHLKKVKSNEFTFANKEGEYEVTAKLEGMTTDLVGPKATIKVGRKVELTFNPVDGREIVDVNLKKGEQTITKGTPKGNSKTVFTFTMPENDITLDVTTKAVINGKPVSWDESTYSAFGSLAVTVLGKEERQITSGDPVEKGASVEAVFSPSLTATPKKIVESFDVDGVAEVSPVTGKENTWRFIMGDEPAKIKITLKDKPILTYVLNWDLTDAPDAIVKVVVDGQEVPNGAKIEEEKELTISVTPGSLKYIVDTVRLNRLTPRLNNGVYKETMPAKNSTLRVVFAKRPKDDTRQFVFADEANQYKVTAKVEDKDLLQKDKNNVTVGDDIVLTIAPDGTAATTGKVVKKVLLAPEDGSTPVEATRKDRTTWNCEMQLKHSKLTVELGDPEAHKLTLPTIEGVTIAVTVDGSALTGKEVQVLEGKMLKIKITTPDDKAITAVKFGEEVLTEKDGFYEVPMWYEDIALSVEATAVHKLILTPQEGITITATVEGAEVKDGAKIPEGKKVVVSVSVTDDTLELSLVEVNGEVAPQSADGLTREFDMPTKDATITVSVKKKEHALTIVNGGATLSVKRGDRQVKDGNKVPNGEKVTLEITQLPKGMLVEKVTITTTKGDEPVTLTELKGEFVMPNEAATLTVVLMVDEGNLITVTDGGAKVKIMNGTTEVTSTTKVKAETDLVITVTNVPEKKEIESVKFNNAPLTPEADKSYKVKMSATAATLVVTLKDKTPQAVEDVVFAGVVVAPNPFAAQLRIVGNGVMGRYALLNTQGQVLVAGELNATETEVAAAENIPAGLYLLRLSANGVSKTFKVVKK